jgi:hypothetical protein
MLLLRTGYRAGNPGMFGAALDTDVVSWAAAVATNGGTVSGRRLVELSTFVAALKAAGSWALTDDMWMLVAENAIQALTSLKQRRLGTAVNSPPFFADAGYIFDGAANYIDTGFMPSVHAVAMTISSVRVTAYERANLASNGNAAGISQSTGRAIGIRPRTAADTFSATANFSGGTWSLPTNDSRGYWSGSRNGSDATTTAAYKKAVALTRTADPTTFGVSLPTLSVFIGGLNSAEHSAAPAPRLLASCPLARLSRPRRRPPTTTPCRRT